LNKLEKRGASVERKTSTLLHKKNDLTKFELFIKNREEEDCAAWNFNNALYHLKKIGMKAKTEKILLNAHKNNEFVIDYMLGIKKMPKEQPQHIGRGDENEAIAYVFDTWKLWNKTEGAFDWLYEFKQKRLKTN
jgi:hypothetical protein